MAGLIDLLQSFGILLVGLIARALLALVVIAIGALPIAGVLILVRMSRSALDRARGLLTTGHVRWQQGRYYAPGHLWLKPETGGALLVGMDDLAQRLLPAIDNVAVAGEGMWLKKGETLGTVTCGERSIALRSPIEGKVVAINPKVTSDPSTVHRDPYRRGWLLSMKPGSVDYDAFTTGPRAEVWFKEEDRRLTAFLEDRLGLAAADGGELTMPPHALLSDAAWQEMERRFFSTV